MTAGSTSDPDGGATYLGRLESRTAARLITKDDHLKRLDKAELAARSAMTALTTGPLNIMAALGSGEALIASGLAGIVQVLGEAAIWADGRRRVVATAFAEMEPDQVEEWLQHDTRNLTLAVQAVIQATAAFDHQKIDALGRAFRSGVTDSARVDESLLVSSLWAHWSAHISTFCTSLRAKSRCYGVSSTTRPMKVRTHAPVCGSLLV